MSGFEWIVPKNWTPFPLLPPTLMQRPVQQRKDSMLQCFLLRSVLSLGGCGLTTISESLLELPVMPVYGTQKPSNLPRRDSVSKGGRSVATLTLISNFLTSFYMWFLTSVRSLKIESNSVYASHYEFRNFSTYKSKHWNLWCLWSSGVNVLTLIYSDYFFGLIRFVSRTYRPGHNPISPTDDITQSLCRHHDLFLFMTFIWVYKIILMH